MKRSNIERKAWLSRKGKVPLRKGDLARKTRVRARSKKNAQMDGWRRQEAAAVTERAHGKCEVADCQQWGREVHHNFGRREEPYSSWRMLCSLVCRDHHEEVTGMVGTGLNVALRQSLRAGCALRLASSLGPGPLAEVMVMLDERDEIRWLAATVERMKANGVEPPNYTPPKRGGTADQEDQ